MISVNVKACGACAKAKRRCGRQLPACERCTRLRLDCTYSSALGSSLVHVVRPSDRISPDTPFSPRELMHPGLATPGSESPSVERHCAGGVDVVATSPASTTALGSTPAAQTSSGSNYPSLEDVQSAWFLQPETWDKVALMAVPNRRVDHGMLREFSSTVLAWFADWVTHGSNPFVHEHLYATHIPAVISSAFTMLSSYVHRTPATEQMIFRIIEAQLTELVATESQRPSVSGSFLPEGTTPQSRQLDVMGHLSRVQALIVYLAIGLFHGDIRQRHVAERHLPLLAVWPEEMRTTTAHAAATGQLLVSEVMSAPASAANAGNMDDEQAFGPCFGMIWRDLAVAEQEAALWHTWILTESVRRTWLVARSIETIYLLLRDQSIDCPGGLMFTSRKGTWEARSAFQWTKICAEHGAGFLHIGETEKLFSQPTSDGLDEFAKFTIQMNYRTDRTRRWILGESCD